MPGQTFLLDVNPFIFTVFPEYKVLLCLGFVGDNSALVLLMVTCTWSSEEVPFARELEYISEECVLDSKAISSGYVELIVSILIRWQQPWCCALQVPAESLQLVSGDNQAFYQIMCFPGIITSEDKRNFPAFSSCFLRTFKSLSLGARRSFSYVRNGFRLAGCIVWALQNGRLENWVYSTLGQKHLLRKGWWQYGSSSNRGFREAKPKAIARRQHGLQTCGN